jgi:hypothetical protein
LIRFIVAIYRYASTPGRRYPEIIYNKPYESSIAGEVSDVLPEHALIEVLEGGFSVDVTRDDSGPVVVAAVAGGPLGESLEFAGCVPAVISTVAPATFPLVLEIPLEAVVEWRR